MKPGNRSRNNGGTAVPIPAECQVLGDKRGGIICSKTSSLGRGFIFAFGRQEKLQGGACKVGF